MTRRLTLRSAGVLSLTLAFCAGCEDGPEVAAVEGVVTLDGQPLEDALLIFTPVEGGRQSAGLTDADGRYKLAFSRDRDGALPGDHTVSISTYREGDADQGTPPAAEKVPAVYNTRTGLTQHVAPSDNAIDFTLISQGDITPPSRYQ